MMHNRPQARTEGLVSEHVGDELVVYDRESHTAHSLSAEAALVWERCDGRLSPAEIGRELALEQVVVEQALGELSRCGLLDDGPTPGSAYSRREAVVGLAKVGGAAFAAPLIYSVAINPAIAAASCAGGQQDGTSRSSSQCNYGSGAAGADGGCLHCTCYHQNNGCSPSRFCVASGCKTNGQGCTSDSQCCHSYGAGGGTCTGGLCQDTVCM
jgi:hypothetical protein